MSKPKYVGLRIYIWGVLSGLLLALAPWQKIFLVLHRWFLRVH